MNSILSAKPAVSISAGSYAGDVAPQSNKFTFNESDYVPSAQNGYHLGDYPQTEMYGDPTDYQRQMAANAIGYNLGSLEPRQQTWFSKTQQNTPQDSFGKAFQAAENPTTTQSSNFISGNQAKQFGSLMQTARNNGGQFNQQDWNTLKSFQNPVSDVAPTVGGINTGATGNQAFDEKMNLRRWLEWDAQQNGVTNPLVSLDRYKMFMQPMRQQAELDELRNAYYIMNSDPNDKRFTPEQRMNARTLVEFDKKNPYYVDDHDMNVERFNWAKQNFNNQQELFPYKLRGAQLGLDRQELALEDNRYNTALKNLQIFGDYGSQNFEGSKWNRKEGVDLNNMQPQSIAGLNHAADIYYQLTGEPLFVTSGRDSNVHVGGKFSHYNGYKVDVATDKLKNNPALRQAFINECAKYGIMIGDEYTHPSPGSTGGHLDLQFAGYKGNYTNNRNKNSQTSSINYNDPFDAKAFSNAAYLWGGGADGKSKPNAELAKVLATKFVKDYVDALKKNGGNPQRAINTVQEIIKKDKQIAGPIEGNPMFDKLIFSIANEAALIASGQGGQAVQMPTEQSQTTKTDKPTNLGGWGAKVGNDNSQDRSKRDKSLDAIDNAELDENRIGMYNLDGYGQVPDAQDLNKQTGTRSYYESLLKYFGSGT